MPSNFVGVTGRRKFATPGLVGVRFASLPRLIAGRAVRSGSGTLLPLTSPQRRAGSRSTASQRQMQRFVDEIGKDLALESKAKTAGDWRYDFTPLGKERFHDWLRVEAQPDDFSRWAPVIELLASRVASLQPQAADEAVG